MDFILAYSIFVGVIFLVWMLFIIRMYKELNKKL
jgi:hypothetical protein